MTFPDLYEDFQSASSVQKKKKKKKKKKVYVYQHVGQKNSNGRALTRKSCTSFLSRVVVVGLFLSGILVPGEPRRSMPPGKSRESQILPSVREPTSSERETSLITPGFGIEFHPPSPHPQPEISHRQTLFHVLSVALSLSREPLKTSGKVSKVETRFLDEFLGAR